MTTLTNNDALIVATSNDPSAADTASPEGRAFKVLSSARLQQRNSEATLVSFTRPELRQALTALERTEQRGDYDLAFDALREKLKEALQRMP